MNGRPLSVPGGANLRAAWVCFILLACASWAWGDVFNMPAGLTSLEFVTVGNPGNKGDPRVAVDGTSGYGSVGYEYRIGKFEVTMGQYAEFLNAVAKTDAYALYNTGMTDNLGLGYGIVRAGTMGSYTYSVRADWANRPVFRASWADAARFANWLTNGQPTGAQDPTTTEDGSYLLNGATTDADLMAVVRKPDARYVIPTEDEWYKAAYHKNDKIDEATTNYFLYPTSSDDKPSNELLNPDPGNNANWSDLRGDPPTRHLTVDSPYYRSEVGDFENSESPYGTFDQGGNVWEWNEGVYVGSIGTGRRVRGGCYMDFWFYMASDYYGAAYPSGESLFMGFRVAETPEPASAGLMALGAASLFARRRMAANDPSPRRGMRAR